MKNLLVLILALTWSLEGYSSNNISIFCTVRGRHPETFNYQTVVSGILTIDPESIPLREPPSQVPGACTPSGIVSHLFGNDGGTRLQITASKCGTNNLYFSYKVILNGLPVVGWLDPNFSAHITFNEDGTSAAPGNYRTQDGSSIALDPLITVPEGTFSIIYLNCMRRGAQ